MEPYRLPEPIMRASTSNFTMGHLVHQNEHPRDADLWPPTQEWLLGHRMPPFQRPPVWSKRQAIRFIESAWLGLHLGTYVVNRVDRGSMFVKEDLWLIDGQQRLRAVKAYLEDEFAVFGFRWSWLNGLEKRRFDNMSFACALIHEGDETKLRDLYNRLNFGGTSHKKSERA